MLKKILLLALLPAIAFAEEFSVEQAIEKQGITIIKTLMPPGGMKVISGKYQDMGVTIYLTPDAKYASAGYNEKGANREHTYRKRNLRTSRTRNVATDGTIPLAPRR